MENQIWKASISTMSSLSREAAGFVIVAARPLPCAKHRAPWAFAATTVGKCRTTALGAGIWAGSWHQKGREYHRSAGLHHGIDGLFFDLRQVLASGRAGAALIDILPRASTGAGCLLGATAGYEVPADDCLLSEREGPRLGLFSLVVHWIPHRCSALF